MTEDAI